MQAEAAAADRAGLSGNVVDYLLENQIGEARAKRPYLISPSRTWTYGELIGARQSGREPVARASRKARRTGAVQRGRRHRFSVDLSWRDEDRRDRDPDQHLSEARGLSLLHRRQRGGGGDRRSHHRADDRLDAQATAEPASSALSRASACKVSTSSTTRWRGSPKRPKPIRSTRMTWRSGSIRRARPAARKAWFIPAITSIGRPSCSGAAPARSTRTTSCCRRRKCISPSASAIRSISRFAPARRTSSIPDRSRPTWSGSNG